MNEKNQLSKMERAFFVSNFVIKFQFLSVRSTEIF